MTTLDTTQPLLTQQQTAELLQVSVRSVRYWISEGKLPAYRVGAQIRVRPEDLEGLLRPIPNAGG